MCIVALAWQVLDELPLCILSNRDEFYQRPTAQLQAWSGSALIAGQDLLQGGTWMGINQAGQWAVITNFREIGQSSDNLISRGKIIETYLSSNQSPIRFAQDLEKKQRHYAGFNLFVGNRQQAVYMSNRGEAPQVLPHGVYVVSNGLMSDPWQKTAHLRKRFTQEFLPMLQHPHYTEEERQFAAWDILQDQRKLTLDQLPSTGVSIQQEQLLSSTFIESANYGTRCSNFLRFYTDHVHWLEKNQMPDANGEIQNIQFNF